MVSLDIVYFIQFTCSLCFHSIHADSVYLSYMPTIHAQYMWQLYMYMSKDPGHFEIARVREHLQDLQGHSFVFSLLRMHFAHRTSILFLSCLFLPDCVFVLVNFVSSFLCVFEPSALWCLDFWNNTSRDALLLGDKEEGKQSLVTLASHYHLRSRQSRTRPLQTRNHRSNSNQSTHNNNWSILTWSMKSFHDTSQENTRDWCDKADIVFEAYNVKYANRLVRLTSNLEDSAFDWYRIAPVRTLLDWRFG